MLTIFMRYIRYFFLDELGIFEDWIVVIFATKLIADCIFQTRIQSCGMIYNIFVFFKDIYLKKFA